MSEYEEQRGSEVEEKKQKNAVRTGEVCCGILIAIVLIMMGFSFWVSTPCTFYATLIYSQSASTSSGLCLLPLGSHVSR